MVIDLDGVVFSVGLDGDISAKELRLLDRQRKRRAHNRMVKPQPVPSDIVKAIVAIKRAMPGSTVIK